MLANSIVDDEGFIWVDGMRPTDEQKSCIIAGRQGKSFVIDASAGTGKTATLRFIAANCPNRRFIYLVFNKMNAKEASMCMTDNVFATTAHSLAYHTVIGRNPDRMSRVKNSISIYEIGNITGAYKQRNKLGKERWVLFLMNIVKTITNYCKTLDKKISVIHLPPECPSDQSDQVVGYANEYWKQASKFHCNITHDIYLKMWSLLDPVLDYDTIMFDEAQDANALMVQVVNQQRGNIIAVGDEHQSIYGFAGAVNALTQFRCEQRLPLTQSYRYGQNIADIANDIITKNKGIESNIKGFEMLDTHITAGGLEHTSDTKTIIARTNMEIIKKMLEASENNKKFFVYADVTDIKITFFSLIRLKNGAQTNHPALKEFGDWSELMVFLRNGGNKSIGGMVKLIQLYGVSEIVNALNNIVDSEHKLQPDEGDYEYVFITGHKAKGLEFDNVIINDDFKNYTLDAMKKDKKDLSEPSEDDKNKLNEEINLLYVASTRAKKVMDIGLNQKLKETYRMTPMLTGGISETSETQQR